MDIQVLTTSASNTPASSGSASNPAPATGKDSFVNVFAGQLGKENSGDSNSDSDDAASLAAMLQMLQSLISPFQNTQQNEVVKTNGDSEAETLPDALLQVMNSNPQLAGELLQNPSMKQWLAQTEPFLNTFTDSQATTALSSQMNRNPQAVDALNLQAQNVLLTLDSLTKQQPDNPILQFLNEDLQHAIEPLLPQLTTSLKSTKAPSSEEQATDQMDGFEDLKADAAQTVSIQRSPHKRVPIPAFAPIQDPNTVSTVQPTQLSLNLLAVKTLVNVPVMQIVSDAQVALNPLQEEANPVEDFGNVNAMTMLSDLQKAQLASTPLEKASTPTLNAANFPEEMTEHVLKNMKITLSEGVSEAKLSLFPKNLGHIDVKISMHEGQLVAQFAAETVAGRQMLESQLPQLRQSLQSQGLQVEKLEVTQGQSMQSGMFQQDQRQQQSFNQSQRQTRNRSGNFAIDGTDFNSNMQSATETNATLNGNSFDVTA